MREFMPSRGPGDSQKSGARVEAQPKSALFFRQADGLHVGGEQFLDVGKILFIKARRSFAPGILAGT